LFAPNVSIFTSNHGYADINLPINDQPEVERSVRIGRNTWLGCGVIVLAGVTIGEGAIVGAGSVVNKNVEPFEIVAGNPARKIGSRLGKTKNL
jgi:acetyltransferase-like isoleucine patch superfamily enzyme